MDNDEATQRRVALNYPTSRGQHLVSPEELAGLVNEKVTFPVPGFER